MLIRNKNYCFLFLLLFTISLQAQKNRKQVNNVPATGTVWTAEKANTWYGQHKWLTGANYIPATAINQLEMWQADTFDPATIDKELSWAESIGFNTMRVFLHSIAWKQDPGGFKKRVDQFLSISAKHHIEPIFVFFDDCWNKDPMAGRQPAVKTGIHNSGWMQDPGQPASADTTIFPSLEKYVKDVLTSFGHDKRILLWDLYNEPGNNGKGDSSLPLLTKIFQWSREVNPDQPVSAGLWAWNLEKLNAFQLKNSDVITYHDYQEASLHKQVVQVLKANGRTKDLAKRQAQHANDPVLGEYSFNVEYRTNNYSVQRGLEHRLYKENPSAKFNKIKAIRDSNPNKKGYIRAAQNFLKNQ